MTDIPDEAGYSRPPKASRFRKGKSGNPKGRPKGSRNFDTDLGAELRKKIRVREDGTEMTVSKQEAVVMAMVARALKGDSRALGILVKVVERLDANAVAPPEALGADERQILDSFRQTVRDQVTAELGLSPPAPSKPVDPPPDAEQTPF